MEIFIGGNTGNISSDGSNVGSSSEIPTNTLHSSLLAVLQELQPENGASNNVAGGRIGGRSSGTAIGDYALGDITRIVDQLMQTDAGIRGNPPASIAAIAGLEEVIIAAEDGEQSVDSAENAKLQGGSSDIPSLESYSPRRAFYRDCPVCQEKYEPGERCKLLPCQHAFHPNCILPWLKVHNTCPVCRFELPIDKDASS